MLVSLMLSFLLAHAHVDVDLDDSPVRTKVERRQELLEDARLRRDEVKKELRLKRSETKDTFRTKRQEFREGLALLKDRRKKEIVEKVDARLSAANEKWTNHWTNVLSRLSEILAKIEKRADGAIGDEIASANEAIGVAQEGVTAQAGKSYIIEVNDEDTLGQSVHAVVREFKADLESTKSLVKSARESVKTAFRALKELKNG